jgi:hypothetical protein
MPARRSHPARDDHPVTTARRWLLEPAFPHDDVRSIVAAPGTCSTTRVVQTDRDGRRAMKTDRQHV